MIGNAFRELLQKAQPCFTIPSHKHLCSKLIPERCTTIKDHIKAKLQKTSAVYLTMDLWSSRDMRSFMGITGHFIIDYTLESVMLGCTGFFGSHTGEAVHASYDETVTEFEIANQVKCVITDGASNMVKAFNLPGYDVNATTDDDPDDQEECDNDALEAYSIDLLHESDDLLCAGNGHPFFPRKESPVFHTHCNLS